MAVIAKYGISGKDYGILAVAFPGVRQCRKPFPLFVGETKVIVIADDPHLEVYPDKEVIQICRDAEVVLDTRMGFLKFLGSLGVRGTDNQVQELLLMDDRDFWEEAKIASLLKYFPRTTPSKDPHSGKLYRLYDVLFTTDFETIYREYYKLHQTQSHEKIISGLLTMNLKGREVNRRGDFRPYYRNILQKNRPCEPIFKAAALNYFESRMGKMDFLSFLYQCSEKSQWRELIEDNRNILHDVIRPYTS